jgi:demethylmenaquinone methyltransferase/2-methoxy-6-polyprenyl-1,4-benzoquinol methylase/phosphoethanolamine N-methyltransferase
VATSASGHSATAPHTAGRLIHWARLYDLGVNFLSFGWASSLRRRAVELAGLAPGERVLDVGCGPGRLAILAGAAVGPAGEARGIDPSPEMIALARENAARAGSAARFEIAAIEALPYPDGRFDAILSTMMLHHLPDALKRRGLAEVLRVLRPGGRLVAIDFAASPGQGLDHILSLLRVRRGWAHAESLREMLREAGFAGAEMGPAGPRALAFVRGQKPG